MLPIRSAKKSFSEHQEWLTYFHQRFLTYHDKVSISLKVYPAPRILSNSLPPHVISKNMLNDDFHRCEKRNRKN